MKKELGTGFRRELWRDKAGASSIPDLLGGGEREEQEEAEEHVCGRTHCGTRI